MMKIFTAATHFLGSVAGIVFTTGQLHAWDKEGVITIPKPEPAERIVYEDDDLKQIDDLIVQVSM